MSRHRSDRPRRLLADRWFTPGVAALAVSTGALTMAGSTESTADRPAAAAQTVRLVATGLVGETASPRPGPSRFERLDALASPPVDSGPRPTGEEPGFLGAADLPEVPGVRADWVGTDATDARRNGSATPCDGARFSRRGVRQEQVRTFVVPHERRLPATFGLSETVGRFPSPRSADRFAELVRGRMGACEARVSSARVGAPQRVRSPHLSVGRRWTMRFELGGDRYLSYRMGLVRVGDRVAQVTFSPADRHDVKAGVFERLLVRAGQRLDELPG